MRIFLPFLLFGFVLFLTGNLPAQALPVRVTSNSRVFSIPFEIRPDLSADPVKEVELMVSGDNGTRWRSVEKRPLTAKKFDFRAEKDGEYWFCFRTVTLSGAVKQTGTGPQLRVLVDTVHKEPMRETNAAVSNVPAAKKPDAGTSASLNTHLDTKTDSYGMLVPPKPLRVKEEKTNKENKPGTGNEEKTKNVKEKEKPTAIPLLISPDGNVAEITKPEAKAPPFNQSESDALVLQLLAGMDKFYGGTLKDIKPSPQRKPVIAAKPPELTAATPNGAVATNAAAETSAVKKLPDIEKPVQPGSISGIALNRQGQQPQLVVKWNTGNGQWKESQVDVLRSFTGQEPYVPIAINLENSGQYWWFLSPDDLKPFFIRIRIRSAVGGILTDTTKTPIQIPGK